MPLFGSKHHNEPNTIDNTNKLSKTDRHHIQPTAHDGLDNTSRTHPTGARNLDHSNNLGPTNTFAPGQHNQYAGNQPFERDHNTAYGGTSGVVGGPAGIPPTSEVSHGPSSGSGGGGQRLAGKVESAIGSLVGSAALKEKGALKEQEANTIKRQGQELAEAERLEAEALMRRERAVAHGAHPANAALGGPNIGTGQGGIY